MALSAAGDDRAAILAALRDRLTAEIDGCDTPRDIPPLAKQLRDTLAELESLDTSEVSIVDDLAARRASRVGDAAAI